MVRVHAALKDIGGRVYVFQSALGSVGEGKLVTRENARQYGVVEQEQAMFTPDAAKVDKFYSELAAFAASVQVCVFESFVCRCFCRANW